jgi:hypothetical protein
MNRKTLLALLVTAAAVCIAGCKEVHMIPTPRGWVEEESKKGGDVLKYKPAEKVEIEYK